MATVGRLDFEAKNPGAEYQLTMDRISENWFLNGRATRTYDLREELRRKGMEAKTVTQAITWIKAHGLVRVEWLGAFECLAPAQADREHDQSPWLTVDEAASYLRVSQRTMRNLVAKERVTTYRFEPGGNLRFKREDLDRCLEPVAERHTVLRAEDYPVLAELWDNEDDAVYDDL